MAEILYGFPITAEQKEALGRLYRRYVKDKRARGEFPDSYRTFRRRFSKHYEKHAGAHRVEFLGGEFAGMFLGIERDGYTHS